MERRSGLVTLDMYSMPTHAIFQVAADVNRVCTQVAEVEEMIVLKAGETYETDVPAVIRALDAHPCVVRARAHDHKKPDKAAKQGDDGADSSGQTADDDPTEPAADGASTTEDKDAE
jgi:hypothetical protein